MSPRTLALTGLTFCALFVACKRSGPPKATGTLLFTGDGWGEVAPCG